MDKMRFFAVVLASSASYATAAAAEYNFSISHRWGDQAIFAGRGSVLAAAPTSGTSATAPASAGSALPRKKADIAPLAAWNLTSSEVASMCRSVLEQEETGAPPLLYSIRVGAGDSAARASAPLCSVLRSNFREEISLTLSAFAGADEESTPHLLGVSYGPLVSPLVADVPCAEVARRHLQRAEDGNQTMGFYTVRCTADFGTVPQLIPSVLSNAPILHQAQLAAAMKNSKNRGKGAGDIDAGPPQGIKFFKGRRPQAAASKPIGPDGNPSPGGEGEQEGEPEEQQGFLRRYWYVFIPSIIMNLTGSSKQPAPEEGEGEGQKAGRVEGGSAAAPAASKAESGNSVRQRRGKKG